MPIRIRLASRALWLAVLGAGTVWAQFEVNNEGNVVTVLIDGALFTQYHTCSGNKPILWPVIGPSGQEMTRGFPMRQAVEGESSDHVHHRSIWFGHGDVNGIDFWSEQINSGQIVHREFLRLDGSPHPVIVTRNDWVDADGEKICSDVRSVAFGLGKQGRWIDFDIRITADADKPVTFGDTKEGMFGVRVASSIKVDADPGGHIVNNLEMTDKDAWGKAASWVDYHGPIGDQTVGIAIFNHPGSFRFPSYWHVRTYGLFAANVFGLHNFKNSHDVDGSHTLQPGESLTFFYRVLLHQGDEQEGRIPEAFIDYAKTIKSPDDLIPEPVDGSSPDGPARRTADRTRSP
jgi:hypothetical protein